MSASHKKNYLHNEMSIARSHIYLVSEFSFLVSNIPNLTSLWLVGRAGCNKISNLVGQIQTYKTIDYLFDKKAVQAIKGNIYVEEYIFFIG